MRKKSLTSDIGPITTAFTPNSKTSRDKKNKSTSYRCFPNIALLLGFLKYLIIRRNSNIVSPLNKKYSIILGV